MATTLYPLFKQALLDSSHTSLDTADIRVILVDLADYTYSAAHDFLDDVPALARVGVSGALQNTSITNGVFDADDITVSNVTGDQFEALIFYIHTGVEATSRLIMFQDTGVTGLPLTPSGTDVILQFDNGANKIFAL